MDEHRLERGRDSAHVIMFSHEAAEYRSVCELEWLAKGEALSRSLCNSALDPPAAYRWHVWQSDTSHIASTEAPI